MKTLLITLVTLFALKTVNAQIFNPQDSLKNYSTNPVPVYPKDYMKKYNWYKRIIEKVYPYALYSADILDEINNNAAAIEKRRKQNNFYKESYQSLKEDFKYFIYELYTDEGIILMKLIHRETKLTVYEIAEKYRGKKNAEVFNMMGKIWDQDIKVKYDPNGDDKIAEHVILDIQNGIIPFNPEVSPMTKDEWKVEQAEDKARAKKYKAQQKEKRKAERKAK